MKKSKVIKPKRGKKYPYVYEAYMDERDFDWEYRSKKFQGRVTLRGYKGAVILRTHSGDDREYYGSEPQWLNGDDLDVLIEGLKQAKKVWLSAYRRGCREAAKNKRKRRRRTR